LTISLMLSMKLVVFLIALDVILNSSSENGVTNFWALYSLFY